MAKPPERDLFTTLRSSGLRRTVAKAVTDASRKTGSRKQSRLIDRTVENLRTAVAEIQRQTGGTKRSESARKAARTRKRRAAARSSAARKAAKTRARKRT
jgi:hypothetical protein